MARLSLAEKIELGAIPLVVTLTAWLTPRFAAKIEIGELIAGAALLILVQGFFRDLWLLYRARQQQPDAPSRSARCMCVESAMGMTGLVVGIGLVGFGLNHPVSISPSALAGVVAATMTTGFLLKDFVFEWSPWKIYREKNHAQVIFQWGK